MLTQAQRARAQAPKSTPVSVPAPVGGLNTRDALDAMAPTDAIIMDNMMAQSTGVAIRGGSSSYATGMSSQPVKTVAEYYTGTTRKMLAAAGGKVWDASAGGVIASSLATGFSSDVWQTLNYHARIFWFNGTDTPQVYDGTTFGSAGWSGPTVTNLIGALSFKGRLYAWERASSSFWYAGVGAVTGAMTEFPLQDVVQYGGNILAITSMSHDGGDGLNDYLCVIMTTGEVVIYNGTNPADATTWSLVGRYRIGAPVNIRAVSRYGADAYVTTNEDHSSLSLQLSALRDGAFAPKTKMCNEIQQEVIDNGSSFGWQTQIYPKAHVILVNIPQADGTFIQHIFKTDQQAWSRWTGLNAYCWGTFSNSLYFGAANGAVYLADSGTSDSGNPIPADCQQAWSPLQATVDNSFNASYRKRLAAVRPVISSVGSISYNFGLGFDYQAINTGVATSTPASGSFWDTSFWDVALWSPETTVDTRWRMAGGTGQSVSFRLRISALQAITWLRTDLRTETGIAL